MGILLLAQKDYDLARKFFIRAVKADTTDPAAQGYLGCALVGLNRAGRGPDVPVEAPGPGSWSTCATPVATPLRDADSAPYRATRRGRRRSQPIDMTTVIAADDGASHRAAQRAHRPRVRNTAAPVAAVVTYVKAGYFDETDDVVGIAHVLEHMFFKGTPTRGVGEIAKADEGQRRLSQRAHDLRSHELLHRAAVVAASTTGLDDPGRRVRELGDRCRRAARASSR